uniref:Putative ovule protein n=1 Tax=Solanum chacoense TaxID=4108 RepID=A0A0V0HFB2_SOLCH
MTTESLGFCPSGSYGSFAAIILLHHKLHPESHQKCLRRKKDCSPGFTNSHQERRWGCFYCVQFH